MIQIDEDKMILDIMWETSSLEDILFWEEITKELGYNLWEQKDSFLK